MKCLNEGTLDRGKYDECMIQLASLTIVQIKAMLT